jgi:HEAT repeat protein
VILTGSSRSLAASKRATTLAVLIMCLVTVPGRAQQSNRPKTDDEKVQELLSNEKYSFEDLLKGKPEAVANTKKIFALTSDPNIKQRAASILLSIGVKDRVYFDYLTDVAKEALNNDMPWPTLYDEQGRRNDKADNPAFVVWCKKHGLDPNDDRYAAYRAADPVFLEWCIRHELSPQNARYSAYYEIPVPWYYLAAARDPRAYELLIQGLKSHNLMIAGSAARGLARLQDPRAIDKLIAVGRCVPGEARAAIAEALLYFPDLKAQKAADELADIFTDKKTWELLRKDAQDKGVKGLFPY